MINNVRMRRPLRKTALASILFAGALLAATVAVEAEQPTKIARIGYLAAACPDTQSARTEAFRLGLHDLGYIEGQNIAIEYRCAEDKPDRLPDFAAELVRLRLDLIVTAGNEATQAAKNATAQIPLVTTGSDPVASGFVANLAHPGGNITGSASMRLG